MEQSERRVARKGEEIDKRGRRARKREGVNNIKEDTQVVCAAGGHLGCL